MYQLCEYCGEYEAEYQCDCCGKLVCQNCWNTNGICDDCRNNIDDVVDSTHSLFGK